MPDAVERADFILTLVLLHNYRIRTGHPNQIKSVYAPLLEERAKQEELAMGVAAARAAGALAADDDAEEERYADDPSLAMMEGMDDDDDDDGALMD